MTKIIANRVIAELLIDSILFLRTAATSTNNSIRISNLTKLRSFERRQDVAVNDRDPQRKVPRAEGKKIHERRVGDRATGEGARARAGLPSPASSLPGSANRRDERRQWPKYMTQGIAPRARADEGTKNLFRNSPPSVISAPRDSIPDVDIAEGGRNGRSSGGETGMESDTTTHSVRGEVNREREGMRSLSYSRAHLCESSEIGKDCSRVSKYTFSFIAVRDGNRILH